MLSVKAFFCSQPSSSVYPSALFYLEGAAFYGEVTGTFYIDECNCRQQVRTGISNRVTRDRFIVWLYCLWNKGLFQLMN